MEITENGIIPATPIQIREKLLQEVQAEIPEFSNLPSGLENNLIDESVIILAQIQDMVVNAMNSVAPTYANDYLIKELGAAFGLTMKDKALPIGSITFTGTPATYIPAGIEVKNDDGSKSFKTTVSGVIGANRTVNITCEGVDYYDTPTPENTLTNIVNQVIGVESCTNPNDITESVEAETIKEYRERFQLKAMANKIGTPATITTNLLLVKGVVKRLLNFRAAQINDGDKAKAVLEVVVGGGDDYEVANALFNSTIYPDFYYSNPSSGESQRKIDINVEFNGVAFPITFTRPKIKQLSIEITLSLKQGFINIPSEAYTVLQKPFFENYVNNLVIGNTPTGYSFDNLIYECFFENDFNKDVITGIEYSIEVDGRSASLNSQRQLATEFDEAYTLLDFKVFL